MYSVATIIIAITALATFMGLSNGVFFDRFKFNISKKQESLNHNLVGVFRQRK
jgi:hypothetical protein